MTHASSARALSGACATFLLAALLGAELRAQGRTWTSDADFDEGLLVRVNHDAPNQDQLQLDPPTAGAPFPFVALAATGRGTMLRLDARTGAILGEYRTAPEGLLREPTRTAVDAAGNVWLANGREDGGGRGSVVKIGLVVGGTRVDASGTPDPAGEYLAPPFVYSTCVDRDGDGLIRTSRGLGDVLGWPNVSDGAGGPQARVEDAFDECILVFQRTEGARPRHLSLDAEGNPWVGGYPAQPDLFERLDRDSGAVLASFGPPACGGWGGLVDAAGVLWSASLNEGSVLRRELASGTATCLPVSAAYGTTLDREGAVWAGELLLRRLWRFLPDGTTAPGFPVTLPAGTAPQGLASTPADGHVWVADFAGARVLRVDASGALVETIPLGAGGQQPTGLAVDLDGKLWVSCLQGNSAKRIDPSAGPNGLGGVELTVSLPVNTVPDNYGDMTGLGGGAIQAPNGFWSVVHDGGAAGVVWTALSWNAQVPAETALAVLVRSAEDASDLAALPFAPAANGAPLVGVVGRFVEILVRFERPPASPLSPVLLDLTLEASRGGLADCPPGRRKPASLLLFPEFDNRPGVTGMLTVTNTDPVGPAVEVEFVYVGRVGLQGEPLPCLERNRVHVLTANDTLSVVTRTHVPDFRQGFVYAFARENGVPIVHEHLIGQMLVLTGPETVEYAVNPLAYCGLGEPGEATDRDGDGLRDLDGQEYSLSPAELLVPRFFGQGRSVVSDLVLLNLTGGASFDATVDFLVYNDAEEVFSAQHTLRCWDKRPLFQISGVFTQTFLLTTSHAPSEVLGASGIETGWFRVNGRVASSSASSLPDPAVVGLLVERARGKAAADLPFEQGAQGNGDLYPLGVLGDPP